MKLHKTKIDNEIYYYYLKSGAKRWMYRHKYYDNLGKRKEKKKSSFKSEREAYKALLKVKAALLDGQVKKVENSQMTVAQWLDIWYEMNVKSWGIKTKKNRKSYIVNYYSPLLGRYKLNRLSKSIYVREFINALYEAKLKSSTIQHYHDIFKIAINAAVEEGIINRNNFRKITIEKDDKKDNFLDPDELNKFLHYVKLYGNITNYTLILLLAYSGLRSGEAAGLKWSNINFEDETVTVEHTRDKYGLRKPKTRNSYRTIKMDNLVMVQLKKYQKWCIEKKMSFGKQLDKENDLVFISYQSGNEISHFYLGQFLNRLYRRLKSEKIDLKRITPHGLRHTHATALISLSIPPTAIADRLGNTVEMVYRIYSHFYQELETQSVAAFGDFIESGAKFGAK